jgi:hypothetical protein
MGNCQQNIYIVNLNVGTKSSPAQSFYFQFDTGSNIMWLPTTQTNSLGFNTALSPTYQISNQADSILVIKYFYQVC